MSEQNPHEFTRPGPTWVTDTPKLQAFVSRHRPFFILVGVLVAQLLLLSFQITRNRNVRLIQVWAVALFDPVERTLHTGVGAVTKAWRTYSQLRSAQKENRELQSGLVTARSRIQQLSEQAVEADRLRVLLDFKSRLPLQSVAVEVIAASPGENSNAVFIDRGRDSGLTTDLAVVTSEGVVGKIIAIFPRTAQVLLITDPASGVGCMIERTRTQGVLKGAGRNLCQIQYVMNEEPVSNGDSVLTSGLDQIYPKGLPIGTVIQTGDGNIYKKIVVQPTARLNRLETALVILRPSPAQQEATILPPHP